MKKNLSKIIASLVLGSFVSIATFAQSSDSDSSPTFGEIIDVRVINLEVVVTERKDRVSGLTSDDFRLLVDRKEVPIEYFTEVVGGQAVLPTGGDPTAIPALAPGEAVGTRFLVFIDDAFSVKQRRNRVLRKMVEQLPYLGPEDSMAVVAYDGRELELLSSWTTSQRELERVLKKAQERRSFGMQRRLTSDAFYRQPGFGLTRGFGSPFGLRDPLFNDFGFGRGVSRGSQLYSDAQRVVDAATSTLRGFAKPSGRKVMLLLSGGWPTPAIGTGFAADVSYASGGSSRSLLRPLADTANRLGYTLYPVDVKGVETYSTGSAQFRSLGEANFVENLVRDREWVEESSLTYLAEETGGRAMLDGASLTALQRTVEDTRSYYWIGFTPTWQENDQRHRVKVEVKRKGLKVRSRDSYSDLSRQTEVSMLLESAQLFDLPIPGETQAFDVSFGEPEGSGRRKVVVPMKLQIPLDQITLLPYQDGYAAQLELRLAVTDDRGNRAGIPVMKLELRREAEASEGEAATLEVPLKLRRRPHRLLVSLHDPTSGHLMSQRVGLEL
ncbi:MAG: VWA domain-containing protein [Acidobacteriota bacterium]